MKIESEFHSTRTWRKQGKRRQHDCRLSLEVLEDRLAPATLTWTGALSANWGDSAVIFGHTVTNWAGNVTPHLFDSLVFDDTAAPNFTTNNDLVGPLGVPFALTGISIDSDNGYTLNDSDGNGIAIGAGGINCTAPNIGSPTNTINVDVKLSAVQTWTIGVNAKLLVHGVVSGSGNLTKAGQGLLRLNGDNLYTGSTSISAGTLSVEHNNALGTTDDGTSVAAGATLQFKPFGITIPPAPPPFVNYSTPEPVTVNGGTIKNDSGNNTFAGPITLAADSFISTQPGTTLTLTGAIDGSGGLTKQGAGTLELDAINNYGGDTVVAGGILRTSSGANIPFRSAVTIVAGATLDLNGHYQGIGSLNGEGDVTLGNAGTLLSGFNGLSTFFSGLISGAGELRKVGPGILTLSGDNTYQLPTQVFGGTLLISGSQPDSPIELHGGTLGGVGTVGPITAPSVGIISPNTIGSAGTLSVNGDVTLYSAETFTVQLGGPTPGTNYDQLDVTGAVDLGNSRLNASMLGYLAPFNTPFTIINNDGADAVIGTFKDAATLDVLDEGDVFIEPGTGRKLQISYLGTSGSDNDVVLTVVNTNPTVDAGPNDTINEAGTFARYVSFTDPDPDGWTATVDYGDGSNQSFTVFASPFALPDHVYADSGVYTITATVTDSQGGQGFDALSVTVNNLPPTATITGPASGVRGQPRAFTLTATDPSSVDQAANFTYHIDWDGDGTVDETVAAPSPKQIDHSFATLGSITVRMTATDKDGETSAEATHAIDIINVNPTVDAGPDAAIDEASTLTGSGSFADSDPDTWTATVNYGDGSGTQTLTLNADKTFNLSHVYADNGQFTVTVTVTDNHSGADADALVVTVDNLAPAATITGPASGGRGQPLTFTLTASDPSPVDQDANFTYGIDWDGDGTVDETVTGPSPKQIDHSYSTLGSFTVRMMATDKDNGASAVATHTIDIANVAPTVNAGAEAAVNEAATFSRTGSFGDSDPDSWTATVNYGDGSGTQALTLNADKTFNLNHVYADNGQFTVTVTVTDNHGGADSGTLLVTVNNLPPSATVTGPASGKRGRPFSFSLTASDPSPVDQSANFVYRVDWDGNGTVDETVNGPSGLAAQHTYSSAGSFTVRVTATDKDGGVSGVATHPFSVAPDFLVVGPDAGIAPRVRVFDATAPHALRFDFLAYPSKFKGGVRVAAADFNGDNFPDIVTAPGPGTAALVQVFSGNQMPGQTPALLLPAIKPYGNFKGGAFVAVGDVNGDGVLDLIVGPGTGTAPTIKLFSGKDGSSLGSFNAFSASYKGGVTVAAGDVDGDGDLDIIAGAGPGKKPLVRVFDAAKRTQLAGAIGSFLAFPGSFKGGVYVAASDVGGDIAAEVIVGSGPGGKPTVKIFTPTTVATPRSIAAFPGGQKRGVRVGAVDFDGGGKAQILAALGSQSTADVRIFSGATLAAVDSFFAESVKFRQGLFVAGSR